MSSFLLFSRLQLLDGIPYFVGSSLGLEEDGEVEVTSYVEVNEGEGQSRAGCSLTEQARGCVEEEDELDGEEEDC